MKKTLLISMLTMSLIACGGGSSNSSNNQSEGETEGNTNTGVLTDGDIAGVSYTTSSGLTGTTNGNGEFSYADGDQVTFKIGDVQLGETIDAIARITPLDLAESENSRTNLLVFLQSLDSDANHDNGINISTTVSTALANQTIDFEQSPEDFISDATFVDTMAQAGLETVVSPSQAMANFQNAFYKDISGVWQYSNQQSGTPINVLIYIDEDGQYLLGEFSTQDQAGQPGLEAGDINWNAVTTSLTPSINIDTNDEWGLSNPVGLHHLNFDGTDLILTEPDIQQTYIFTKVKNQDNQIIGSWQYSKGQVFSFLENGTYFMLDPIGDDQVEVSDSPCGGAGIESGKYTINGSNLIIHDVSIDTNDCAGLSDNQQGQTLPFSIQGNEFQFSPASEGTFTINRII